VDAGDSRLAERRALLGVVQRVLEGLLSDREGEYADRHPLSQQVLHQLAVRDATPQVKDKPGVHKFGDFAIYNGPCVPAVARQIVRGLAGRARRKVTLVIAGS
jgi:hypothetical protein